MDGKNSNFNQERFETYKKMDPLELEENESLNFFEKPNHNINYKIHSSGYIFHKRFSRYDNALKHLLPFRRKKNKKKVVQIDEAGCFSLITFSWMTKYIVKAYKKGLTIDDIPLCSPLDSCDINAQRLESLWQNELVEKGPVRASFGRVIWKFVRTRVLISALTFLMSCLMGFISPAICMRNLLAYLEEPNADQITGVIWALALTGAEILRVMFFAVYYSLSYRTALRLRSACLTMVFKKVLKLNSARNTSTGEIINLFSFDGPRLYYMIVYGPMAVGGPIISLCGFIYIYLILGPWALLGMIIFVFYYPFQFLISHVSGYYKQKYIEQADKRIKLVTEILMSIKLIKMYAWENWFSSQIQDLRKNELREVQKIAYCQSIGITLAPTIPVISGIAVFLSHVMFGGNLVAAQAFSVLVFLTKQMKTSIQVIRDGSLAFYEGIISVKRFKVYTIMVILRTQLRVALSNARYGIDNFTQGRIIFNRLQDVFMIEENLTVISNQLDDSLALSIKNGFFSWDVIVMEPEHLKKKRIEKREIVSVGAEHKISEVLFSINLKICKGALIGICGPVGAGKSSLLLACLGQLKMTSGEISRLGTCAYVSQQSWIENTTLKENIIFGGKFDIEKYNNVLQACALDADLNFLPGGDNTEVGERGVTLSGGQKQRVALARALYSERDIYFLDDPLSSVDPSVANKIFQKYILESLSQKTVILVTSQIQYLQECDEILVIKDGRIVERGTYRELIDGDNEFVNIMRFGTLVSPQESYDKITENQNLGELKCSEDIIEPNHTKDLNVSERKLIQEKQIRGTIKASTYRAYIAAAGGYSVCFFVFLVILINVGSNVFSSWWLAMWIKAGSGNTTIIDSKTNETIISRNINDNPALSFYMKVYASIIVLIVATCVIRGFVYTKVCIRASRVLHEKLFQKILGSPMFFFERTPIGQIQNLFARDMDEIESRLPESVEAMVQNIWVVMFSFLSITLVFHWFAIPLLLLGCLYYFISKTFRVAIRDLKRIESISRAPVFSSISATIQGLSLIHAFNKENDYINQFCKIFNKSSTNFYLSNNAMRWLAVRLDLISVAITFITSFLVAFLKGEVAPAYAGLALTYSAQICGVLQFTIRLLSENEARFISVERIQNNIEKLKSEGNSEQDVDVPSEWPSKGSINFEEVKLTYEKNLPYVLNNISISISGGEKIGVVGRTGAGKSSLISALFRLVEVSSGKIFIDGVNIARIPLTILRSRLSVIPQDPILFSESLRANLDPYNLYDDNTLWNVLEKTRLLKKVKSMPKEMSTYVGDGENLSVGEKQLVCLARTLLRHSKILVLDEATASIDPETEMALQTVIKNEFRNCTVITIAHRLSTVTNCDRILVVEQGTVVEFDNPKVLMKNPDSRFSKILADLEVRKWKS